jgi:hypothetical protein
MSIRPRNTIKSWFYRGAKPLASMFHDWIDSFYHKDEDKAYVGLRQYAETTDYEAGMTCVYGGAVWMANSATTGPFNPLAWDAVGAGSSYSNAEPTPQDLGGISAGSTFSSASMQQMWTDLLYPYQYPAFTSFGMTGMPSQFEVGAGILAGDYVWTWATSNPANVGINSISISGNGFSAVAGLPNSGSTLITMSAVNLMSAGTGAWTITGVNTKAGSFARTLSVPWKWRAYWGNSANSSLTEAQVKALSGSALATTYAAVRSFPAAAGEYKYVAYPTSFGTATHFTDASTMLAVPFESPVVVSVTNAYGATTNYNVHRSTYQLGGAIDIIVAA